MQVDGFIKQKVLPDHQALLRRLRRLMHEVAPGAKGTFSYGMPVWKASGIVAWMIPTRKDITLGFTRGRQFEDRYGLLRGVGKSARHIKLKKIQDVQKKVLAYYVKQALKLDVK